MEHTPPPPSKARRLPRSRQLLIVGVGAAAVLVLLGAPMAIKVLTAKAPEPEAVAEAGVFRPTKEQLKSMTVVTAGEASFDDLHRASGKIAVDERRSTPVVSPYSGRVLRVLAEPGQWVRQGAPLFVVQATEYAEGGAALSTARAEQVSAAAQLKLAQEAEARAGEIYRTAGGALKDWREAQNALVAAQGAARTADANLAAARSRLAILGKTSAQIRALENAAVAPGAEAVVTAPISGVVMQRAVGIGQNIVAGADEPQFVIADTSTVWLVADAPESEISRMRTGSAVEVTTPAYPGRVFTARVDYVAPALDPETRRLPVRATIGNADGALKPEMFANFAIRSAGGARSGLAVPAEAVIREGDTARLWVLAPDGALRSRAVQTGQSAEGRVQILNGLTAGEKVVTRGAIFVDEAGQAR